MSSDFTRQDTYGRFIHVGDIVSRNFSWINKEERGVIVDIKDSFNHRGVEVVWDSGYTEELSTRELRRIDSKEGMNPSTWEHGIDPPMEGSSQIYFDLYNTKAMSAQMEQFKALYHQYAFEYSLMDSVMGGIVTNNSQHIVTAEELLLARINTVSRSKLLSRFTTELFGDIEDTFFPNESMMVGDISFEWRGEAIFTDIDRFQFSGDISWKDKRDDVSFVFYSHGDWRFWVAGERQKYAMESAISDSITPQSPITPLYVRLGGDEYAFLERDPLSCMSVVRSLIIEAVPRVYQQIF